jgi:DNA invertase Pin-like site-specific DNA recombinase
MPSKPMTPAQKAEHSRKIRAGIAKRKRAGGAIGRPKTKGRAQPQKSQAKKAFTALGTMDLWLLKEKLEIDLTALKDELRNRL